MTRAPIVQTDKVLHWADIVSAVVQIRWSSRRRKTKPLPLIYLFDVLYCRLGDDAIVGDREDLVVLFCCYVLLFGRGLILRDILWFIYQTNGN
jgi:hypothetical protein